MKRWQGLQGNLANGAVYLFSAQFLEELFAGPPLSDLSTQVLPLLMGRINAFHNSCYHRDIGSIESYLHSASEMMHFPSLMVSPPSTPSPLSTLQPSSAWLDFADEELWEKWTQAFQDAARTIGRELIVHRKAAEFLKTSPKVGSINLVQEAFCTEIEKIRDLLSHLSHLSQDSRNPVSAQAVTTIIWKALPDA